MLGKAVQMHTTVDRAEYMFFLRSLSGPKMMIII